MEGTRFDVTVSFKIIDDEESDSEETIKQTVTLEGKRVLLVEDNELNREIVVDILKDKGLIIEEADDGTVAVDIMKQKGPDYYDYILMDIQMPIMNGYEATKTIREMYPDSKLPIFALSANAFSEDKQKSLEAGMDDHISKPVRVKELYDLLEKYSR